MSPSKPQPPFERPRVQFRESGQRVIPDPDYVAELERERAQEIAQPHTTRRSKLPLPKRSWPEHERSER